MGAAKPGWQDEARDSTVRAEKLQIIKEIVRNKMGTQNGAQSPADQKEKLAATIELRCYQNAKSLDEYTNNFLMVMQRFLVMEAKKKPSTTNSKPLICPVKPKKGPKSEANPSAVPKARTPNFSGPVNAADPKTPSRQSGDIRYGPGPEVRPMDPLLDPNAALRGENSPIPGPGNPYSYVHNQPYEPWAPFLNYNNLYGSLDGTVPPTFAQQIQVQQHAHHHSLPAVYMDSQHASHQQRVLQQQQQQQQQQQGSLQQQHAPFSHQYQPHPSLVHSRSLPAGEGPSTWSAHNTSPKQTPKRPRFQDTDHMQQQSGALSMDHGEFMDVVDLLAIDDEDDQAHE
ncbi:Hypothetical Protein FCC1311_112532 [Hondaea fermentalgiana]|uniref:Uncharacterized protein n=1 Tax=Hondaea fermentalgiana TaxID=2315210 RepID=A0A2R5GW17_9STRA|nr:Hypothetical Protein FCC1311_112532 [Hondaea fermentalgiana]|eukprot:GBG35030.1 Hypothetical Protein FCC1311_112532 [Hondaea fermentalgiana]